MKHFLYFIIVAAILIVVSSCSLFEDDNQQKEVQEYTNTIGGLSQEIKDKIAAQDTLMKELVSKVDTLAEALNVTQKENIELKEKLESIQSPRSTWMSIGAIALSIIAVALALFKKGLSEQKILEIVKDRLDNSKRIKELIFHVNTLKNDAQHYSRNSQSNLSVSQNVETRLRQVEKTLNDIVNYINGQKLNSQSQNPTGRQGEQSSNQPERQRVGYAKIGYETYFTTIYDSNQEGCAFKITFKNATKGEFTIIALDRISSSNDWQQKIECVGVSIKDAIDFQVEEPGICENIGNNTWQVTKPLKIRLLK